MTSTIASQEAMERFFVGLYERVFPQLAAFVSKRGGSLEEARDIFQDSLLIFYEKTVNQPSLSPANEKAYLLGIAKNLWYKRSGRNPTYHGLTEPEAYIVTDPQLTQDTPADLLAFLEVAGKKCLDMLKSFYYDRSSLQSIAQRFGFSSVRSATVQKYKCLEKVREEVKQKSMTYEDFTY